MLDRAVEELRATPGIMSVRRSPVYETAPVGFLDQPPFLNAVAELQTTLGPLQLFLRQKQIEAQLGRTATFRWGPREIDLDLLLYDEETIRRRGLVVPHPAMFERAFVLIPLRDLRPDLRDASGRSLDEILARLAVR
jgi:2-amino-4-hydroxy-6-hydroxymethyldihydropteridine diphosphokinase